jgi:hypothetical protein
MRSGRGGSNSTRWVAASTAAAIDERVPVDDSHDQVVGLDLPDRQGFAFIVTGASALLLAAVNHKEAQMPGVVARDFDSPDETRTPDKTKVVGVHQQ